MANLTISLDDKVLKKARLRAMGQGTSVNALLRDYLNQYAGDRAAEQQALENLLRLSARSSARRGKKRWTRDELHRR